MVDTRTALSGPNVTGNQENHDLSYCLISGDITDQTDGLPVVNSNRQTASLISLTGPGNLCVYFSVQSGYDL